MVGLAGPGLQGQDCRSRDSAPGLRSFVTPRSPSGIMTFICTYAIPRGSKQDRDHSDISRTRSTRIILTFGVHCTKAQSNPCIFPKDSSGNDQKIFDLRPKRQPSLRFSSKFGLQFHHNVIHFLGFCILGTWVGAATTWRTSTGVPAGLPCAESWPRPTGTHRGELPGVGWLRWPTVWWSKRTRPRRTAGPGSQTGSCPAQGTWGNHSA